MELVSIGNGKYLALAPAASFERMCKEAGRRLQVTSAYRTPEAQQELYDGWVARKVGYNFALPPEKSTHPQGIAIDTNEYSWFEANANKHGFYRTDPTERWHYVYFLAKDTMKVQTIQPVKGRKTMRVIQGFNSPHVYVTDGVTKRHLTSEEEVKDHYKLTGQTSPDIIGMYTMDRIPNYVAPKAVDLSTIQTQLEVLIDRGSGSGASASEIAQAVVAAIKAAL